MAKVLVCDDDDDMRDTVSAFLEAYGFSVESLADSSELQTRLRQTAYDLLICNAWMEPLDGFVICEALRKSGNPRLRSLEILMVAPDDLDAEQYKILRRQGVHFMMKYKSPEAWFEKVSAILASVEHEKPVSFT